jgi:MFS family permease
VIVHAVLFLASATQSAIVPLLPALSRLDHFGGAVGGFLISAPGLATLAISAPAGLIADRLGAKRVTVAATVLLAAGAAVQALLSVPALVLGRLAFGLAYGIVWTTATAWLAASDDRSGNASLGAVATSSAAGLAAGPGLGGLAAQWVGLAAPFLIIGGAAGVAAVALARQPAAPRFVRGDAGSLRTMTVAASRHPHVFAAAVALAVVGAVGGVTQLLVPLDLHRAGVSTAATGAVFSLAAVFYVLVSGGVTRAGGRLLTIGALAAGTMALSLALLPASFDATPTVLVAVLFISTAPRAMIGTVVFPLATAAAGEDGLAGGTVIGFLNGSWAIGIVVTPVLAGALAGAAGPNAGYLAAVVPGVTVALWLFTRQSRLERSTMGSQRPTPRSAPAAGARRGRREPGRTASTGRLGARSPMTSVLHAPARARHAVGRVDWRGRVRRSRPDRDAVPARDAAGPPLRRRWARRPR